MTIDWKYDVKYISQINYAFPDTKHMWLSQPSNCKETEMIGMFLYNVGNLFKKKNGIDLNYLSYN